MFTDLFQISIQNYETVLNSINLETLSAIHVMVMDSWNLAARNGELLDSLIRRWRVLLGIRWTIGSRAVASSSMKDD